MVKFLEISKSKNESNITKNIETNKEGAAQDSKIENIEKMDKKVNQRNILELNSSLQAPLSQYQIQGKILIFNPNTTLANKHRSKNNEFRHKETAEVRVFIEIINLRTGRSLAKKPFVFISNKGKIP